MIQNYPLFAEWLFQQRRIHGSEILDMFLECYPGRSVDTAFIEDIIQELLEIGRLVRLGREPTASQKAFVSLQYSNSQYASMPASPGTILHYWYGRCIGLDDQRKQLGLI